MGPQQAIILFTLIEIAMPMDDIHAEIVYYPLEPYTQLLILSTDNSTLLIID
jgi:hypothetical protein